MSTNTGRRVEIMAPVGSYESLVAAQQGGADSVYFGVGKLNMRSGSSRNFTLEDLEKITRFAHDHGIRTYLTLNTVIYDHEMDEMRRVADAAKKAGISAIIASDMAVISYARSIGMEIHMSTQTNVSNIEAVRHWSAFADVIVTARELSLDQVSGIIGTIQRDGIRGPSGNLVEVELFAHGALCMAISGKCYLSLDYENSSGNRGQCLQLCRRPYKVTDLDGKHEMVIDNEYIMSPKDLCTIEFLDKILDAGVMVLKIEGRGRPADYVKTVVSCYREAADYWLTGRWSDAPMEEWMARLRAVYNRGFWEGYYLGRKLGEWTKTYGNLATHKKVYAGKVNNFFSNLSVAEIKVEAEPLAKGDTIVIIGPTTGVYEDVLQEIRVDLQPVEVAEKGELCSFRTSSPVRRGDKLYRVVPAGTVSDYQ
ncbi:MAG: peptidase U32 family protein [Bacteroidales bacterium]